MAAGVADGLAQRRSGLAGRTAKQFIVASTILAGLCIAYLCRFVQDDAYISFRYAKNFAEGHGLVFNIGGHTEGYSNFLWTLIMSLPIRLRVDPAAASIGIGLALYPFTLAACFLLLRASTRSFAWSLA